MPPQDGKSDVLPVPQAPASQVDAGQGAPKPAPDKEKARGDALAAVSAEPVAGLTDAPKDEDLGAVHTEFAEKVGKVDEATATKDLETLTGKSSDAYTIEDIRYNSRLFHKKDADEKPEAVVANLKDETARRMKAYAKDNGDGWFELDYEKLGSDKNGLTHELYVGLGDILLDPDIQEILVDKGGEKIKAHRGVVPAGQHHSGRVAFLDENNEYVATHTGDKFRILSSDKLEVAGYIEKLKTEDSAREGGRASFKSSTVELAMAENDVTMKEGISMRADYTDANGKPASVEVTNDVINKAAAECAKTSTIEKAAQRENLMKLLNYISVKVDVPAYAMMAIIYMESGIKFPTAVGDGGLAMGMGQFHPEAMDQVKKESIFHELVGQVTKENPGSAGRNKNIFVDLVAVAVFLKQQSARFGFRVFRSTPEKELTEDLVKAPDGFEMTRLSWVRMGYHVPAYAGIYAKLMKVGSVDKLDGWAAKNYPVAKKWLEEHKDRYMKFSRNAAVAHDAIQRREA